MKRPTSTATRSISISISSLTKKHAITIVVVAVLMAAALLYYLLGMKKLQNEASYSSSARNVPIAARMDLPPTVGNPTGPNRGPVRPPGPGDFDDPSVY